MSLQGLSLCRDQNLWLQCWSDAISGDCQHYSDIRWSTRINTIYKFKLFVFETSHAVSFPCRLLLTSVGVPGRSLPGHRDGRPTVGCTLPAAPSVWRFWSYCDTGPQTDDRQLERRWLPHKCQHQEDEGGRRTAVSKSFSFKPALEFWVLYYTVLCVNYSRSIQQLRICWLKAATINICLLISHTLNTVIY